VRRLRTSYWLVRTTVAARWWALCYDAHTAGRLLRYATLALRGRLLILDERADDVAGVGRVIRLTLSTLPRAVSAAEAGPLGPGQPGDGPGCSAGSSGVGGYSLSGKDLD
jgi:hypothetical protein